MAPIQLCFQITFAFQRLADPLIIARLSHADSDEYTPIKEIPSIRYSSLPCFVADRLNNLLFENTDSMAHEMK